MPVTYTKADEDVLAVLVRMTERFHPELVKSGAIVDVMMAHAEVNEAGEKTGNAVSCHGMPAYAKVRAIGLKDRSAGRGDAEIIIDANKWAEMPPERRDALIDHELEHLEVKVDSETGDYVMDDCNRPKFKLRKHDFQVGWFDSIAKRHGAASIECKQAELLMDEKGQIYFGFAETDKFPFDAAAKQQADASKTLEGIAEPWRNQVIADLKPSLTPAKMKSLDGHSPAIITMGDMADHQKRHGVWWIKEISGFGESGSLQYERATAAYWAANPLPKSPAKDAVPAQEKSEAAIPPAIAEAVKAREESRSRIEAKDALRCACWEKMVDAGLVKAGDETTDEIKGWALLIINRAAGNSVSPEELQKATIKNMQAWTREIAAMDCVAIRGLR
jgi:hypothetical protein